VGQLERAKVDGLGVKIHAIKPQPKTHNPFQQLSLKPFNYYSKCKVVNIF